MPVLLSQQSKEQIFYFSRDLRRGKIVTSSSKYVLPTADVRFDQRRKCFIKFKVLVYCHTVLPVLNFYWAETTVWQYTKQTLADYNELTYRRRCNNCVQLLFLFQYRSLIHFSSCVLFWYMTYHVSVNFRYWIVLKTIVVFFFLIRYYNTFSLLMFQDALECMCSRTWTVQSSEWHSFAYFAPGKQYWSRSLPSLPTAFPA